MASLFRVLVALACCILSFSCLEAQDKVEQLRQKIDGAEGIERLILQKKLINYQLETAPEMALVSLEAAMGYLKELKNNPTEHGLGLRRNPADLKRFEADLYIVLGEVQLSFDKPKYAYKAFKEAASLSEEISYDEGKMIAKENLKRMQTRIFERRKQIDKIAIEALEHIAQEHEKNGDWEKAIKYYTKSLKHFEEKEDSLKLAELQYRIVNIYHSKGMLDEARRYSELDLAEPERLQRSLAENIFLADVEVERKNAEQSRETEWFSSAMKPSPVEDKAYVVVQSDNEAARNGMEKSNYLALKSKVKELSTQRMVDSLSLASQISEKARELEKLKHEQEAQELHTQNIMARERMFRYALTVGMLVLVGVALLFYYLLYIKRRSHKELHEAFQELDLAHKQLKSTQGKLVESEKMASLGQLTAGIAHEINNPVNFISGNVNPLKRDIHDLLEVLNAYENILKQRPELRQNFSEVQELKEDLDLDFVKEEIQFLLQGISEGATRTTKIVRGLRNFARLDEDTVKRFDLHEGLDSTLTLLNHKTKHFEVLRHYGELSQLEAYPGKLNQVFMNLLTNALQALEEKKEQEPAFNGRIELRTYEQDAHAFLHIKDNANGIKEEVKKRIFDPFFTTKEVGIGTGLGLSISLGIIEKHQGSIDIHSEEGKGTEVIIQLPMSLLEEASSEETPAPVVAASSAPPVQAQPKIKIKRLS